VARRRTDGAAPAVLVAVILFLLGAAIVWRVSERELAAPAVRTESSATDEPSELSGPAEPTGRASVVVPDDAERASKSSNELRSTAPARRVRLRVLDESGAPIEGALVRMSRVGGWLDAATTESDGVAEIVLAGSLVDGARIQKLLRVEARGFVGRQVRTAISASPSQDLGEVRLHGGAILRGRVVDEGGAPIAGAEVSCFQDGIDGYRTPSDAEMATYDGPIGYAVASDTTAEDGSFSLHGAPRGRADAWAVAETRCWAFAFSIDTSTGSADTGTIVLETIPAEHALRGRVVDPAGEPLADIEIARQRNGQRTMRAARSGLGGEFVVPAASRGPHTLVFTDPQRRWPPVSARLTCGAEPTTITLGSTTTTRSIAVRVTDRERRPIRIAFTGAVPAGESTSSAGRPWHEPDGDFAITALDVPFDVVACSPGYSSSHSGPWTRESAPDALEIALDRSPSIAGELVDESGPLDVARVVLLRARCDGLAWAWGSIAPAQPPFAMFCPFSIVSETCSTSGEFRLDLPPDGCFAVWAETRNGRFVHAGPFEIAGAEVDLGVLVAEVPGSIEGTVAGAASDPPATVVATDGYARAVVTHADEGGRFELGGLAPGRWQVRVGAPERAGESERWFGSRNERLPSCQPEWTCTVEPGRTTRVVIPGPAADACVLRGRFRSSELPADAWRAELLGPDARGRRDPVLAAASLDDTGTFVLTPPSPGKYVLRLTSTDETYVFDRVEIADGRNEWALDLDVVPLALGGLEGMNVSRRIHYVRTRTASGAEVLEILIPGSGPVASRLYARGELDVICTEFAAERPDLLDPGWHVHAGEIGPGGGTLRPCR
jgi:protocatechuate 3,4-dioxygenase beta subunit